MTPKHANLIAAHGTSTPWDPEGNSQADIEDQRAMTESGATEMQEKTRPDELIPRAIWSGSFRVFGVDVQCHTLSNGQRIIEAESLANLLEAMSQTGADIGDTAGLFAWQRDGRLT